MRGSASAAASVTAPRMPGPADQRRVLPGRIRIAFADPAEQKARQIGRGIDPDHSRADDRRAHDRGVSDQRAGRAAGERVENRPELEPDEPEQERVEQEREDAPHGVALEARLRVRELRRVPADVDADRHGGEHRRHAGRLGRQVREVSGQKRDRDLGRRVIHPAPDLAKHEPDGETDRDAARDVDDEMPRRVPEREAAGHHRRDGEAIRNEGGRVVDEALALDQRGEPPRNAETRRDRVRRHRIGRCDECTEHEADRPGEPGDCGMADRRDREHRDEHKSDRKQ